jgi:hypothetical protein
MLVLTRKTGERVHIGTSVVITVVAIDRGRVQPATPAAVDSRGPNRSRAHSLTAIFGPIFFRSSPTVRTTAFAGWRRGGAHGPQ